MKITWINSKMKTITKIQALPLAIGIQKIMLDMIHNKLEGQCPIEQFERLIMESKQVSEFEAKIVTEKVLATGIVRRSSTFNCFVL